MERIATPRLVLRPVAALDQAPVVAGVNDFAVSGWLAVVPYPYRASNFNHFLTDIAKPGTTWALEEAGRFAGILGLEKAALGYWPMPSAQGRGLATEAAGAVLAAHFAGGGGDVASGYFQGNARSARVLGKLGFIETGRDVKFCRSKGGAQPHVSLRLTRAAFGKSAFNLA